MLYTDQVGHRITLNRKPKRVISLVPSQSELLWDLGLRNELVGISKFCIHPGEMFRSVERVGGTKNLDLDKIRRLKPDLIVGNKEENERAQIETLQKEFNVWMSDIYNFEDAFEMMGKLGIILGREQESKRMEEEIRYSLAGLENTFAGQSVAYFIWNKPYMFAANRTFIDHVLKHLGFTNALEGRERYPQLGDEELRDLSPGYCFLSSEPFPFNEKHVRELQTLLPQSKVILVDGEMFSWYGSRLRYLAGYTKTMADDLLRK
jgi:ABC-type Fe3+-hydroxamate transport system substrate-binding protein